MRTLVLETTSPFRGLPGLLAFDEGLFAREGLDIRWAERDEAVNIDVQQQAHAAE